MSSTSFTTIDLVRHGEVKTPELFCAPADEPLSKLGWAQLKALEEAPHQWDQIISSPHLRCRTFAEKFAAKQQCALHIDERLREMEFGDWCGKTRQEIWQRDQKKLQQLWTLPLDFTAPGGESMVAFIARVQAAWRQLLAQYAGQSLILLGHAGVIRIILSISLDISPQSAQKFNIEYGKINRIRHYQDNEYSLEGWCLG